MSIDASAVARVVGIDTEFKNLQGGVFQLPQHIAVVGQGNSLAVYTTEPRQFTSAFDAAEVYGFGSPIHLALLQLFPANGDGVGTVPVTVFPLEDDAAGVASTGDIALTGIATESGTIFVKINNIRSEPITIILGEDGDDLEDRVTDAINAILEMPVIALAEGVGHTADLTSKWEGLSANDIFIEIEGTVAGITPVITPMAGGLVNPDVQDALDVFGTSVWYTMVLNCLEIADTIALDAFSTFGEGRWGALVKKPLVVFTGNNELTVALATAVSDVRKTDRTNAQLVAPGSNDLPLTITARQLARIAVRANNNPAFDYGSLDASGLTPGADSDQWDYADQDSAIKKGSSTIKIKDGVINLADTVTFFHPDGDPTPAYRYVVDIVKLQNIIFNLDLIFNTPEWDGAPLIPDNQPTTNRAAKKPKMAKAAVASMLDALGLLAIISDPDTAKDATIATINGTNPKRLDIVTTVQLSGNSNIISIDLEFGFFFGVQPIVA